jgi:Peptidase A4 family
MAFGTGIRFRLAVLAAAAVALLAAGAAGAATVVTRDVSSNWAGYVVTGASFTSASGTWVQPALDCTSTGTGSSAFWIGLGGNSTTSASLEQAGTTADCNADGSARYWAWYELVPASAVKLSLKVLPGDTISATVSVTGSNVTMTVKNLTRKTAVTRTKTMASPDTSSAEWVTEAPSLCSTYGRCRTVTLADFGKVKFTNATATAGGHTGTISNWAATAIELVSDFRGRAFGRFAAEYTTTANAVPTALSAHGKTFAIRWQANTAAAMPLPGWR